MEMWNEFLACETRKVRLLRQASSRGGVGERQKQRKYSFLEISLPVLTAGGGISSLLFHHLWPAIF